MVGEAITGPATESAVSGTPEMGSTDNDGHDAREVTPPNSGGVRRRGAGQRAAPGRSAGKPDALTRIRVVLVQPTGPRNVGSTARAMKNFGLNRLVLVDPPPLDHPECLEMGVNAHDVLRDAKIVDSVEEAVRDVSLVVGTTARRRHRLATLTPAEIAPRILEVAEREEVAILFGTERTGLTEAQMAACQVVISARTHDEHVALNLGQAVLLVAHHLFEASGASGATAAGDTGRLLTTHTRHILEDELFLALEKTGVVKDETRVTYRASLRRILAAGPIQTRDARVLFALARHAQKLADPKNPGRRPPRSPRPRDT